MLCIIMYFSPSPNGPESAASGSVGTCTCDHGTGIVGYEYAHTLIKFHFMCVCVRYDLQFGAFASAQDQGAFPFPSKVPPTLRERELFVAVPLFLPEDQLLGIRFSSVARPARQT